MELADKKHDDIWTPHKGTVAQPNRTNRNIHVQTHTNYDEPTMEGWRMVPREETTLSTNTTTDYGIMDKQKHK